jgi:hypothetical protein
VIDLGILKMTRSTPTLAYKYLPLDRLSYLEDQFLRFSQPGCLNDPFECSPGLPSDVAGHLIQLANGPSPIVHLTKRNVDKVLVPYLERLAQYINSRVGILCLSKKWNSTLMWSHYANDHRGFCIGFDVAHPFFSTDYSSMGGWCPIREVNYSSIRPQAKLEHVSPETIIELVTTKHADWAYEQEVRLMRGLEVADKTLANKEGLPIALFQVPHAAIREIYSGRKTPQPIKEKLRTYASRFNAKFYEADISIASYDLRRWPSDAQLE